MLRPIACLCVCVVLSQSAAAQQNPPSRVAELSKSVTSFALDFGGLSSGDNYVFSPVSISSVLSGLLLGAGGRTYYQLQAALQYRATDNVTVYHEQYRRLLETVNSPGQGVKLNLANKLFFNEGFSLKPPFVRNSLSYYHSAVEILDFYNDPLGAQRAVNDWVSSSTNNKIPQILGSPPDPATKMIAANAVYFHGLWDVQFNQSDSRIASFTSDADTVVQIPFMYNILSIPYASSPSLDCRIIGLPYVGRSWHMYVIMPKQDGVQALTDVESRLDADALDELLDSMRTRTVSVGIPRLRANMRIRLNDELAELGLEDLFDPAGANFDGVSDDDGLYLSEVVHQALIDINEQGTEAAAASVATMSRDRPSASFFANKPFLAIIMDTNDRVPLFWLRMTRPVSSRTTG